MKKAKLASSPNPSLDAIFRRGKRVDTAWHISGYWHLAFVQRQCSAPKEPHWLKDTIWYTPQKSSKAIINQQERDKKNLPSLSSSLPKRDLMKAAELIKWRAITAHYRIFIRRALICMCVLVLDHATKVCITTIFWPFSRSQVFDLKTWR